ncbi:MAG: AMP-binding protein [Anaerolineales bacterium]|nr:AMP-binding protein [Anaerolineales bacterium]
MAMRSSGVQTISTAIAEMAGRTPDIPAVTLIAGGHLPVSISLGQLHRLAQRQAEWLLGTGIRPGDRVVITGEHDLHLVAAFVSALYAGTVPAFSPYPSAFRTPDRYLRRLCDMTAGKAQAVLATSEPVAQLLASVPVLSCPVLVYDDTRIPADSPGMPPYAAASTGPAYLQYSSGTTGAPKAAMVSHRALLQHLKMLAGALALKKADVLVGWAPYYHDLGLVVYLLLPLVMGASVVTLPPGDWVRRPQHLLRVLHEYRGAICMMPAFGFTHMMRSVRPRYGGS